MNAGLATLQMNSIAVSPYLPDTAMTGTQDNGTLSFSGAPTWFLPLTGDGGDSGFDATSRTCASTRTPAGRWTSTTTATIRRRGCGSATGSSSNFPEAQRFYAPVISDPVVSKTIFVGAQRVWRTQDLGGDRSFLEQHCNTAVGEFPSDLLYTGACGSADHWPPLGAVR